MSKSAETRAAVEAAIASLAADLGEQVTASPMDEVVLAGLVSRALAGGTVIPRATLALAARQVAARLGMVRPGRTIEVRVPPFTAVQIGSADGGPTHTRGTPPTVVETDVATFLALASGDVSWVDAVAARKVTASGVHADLSDLFPLA